MKQTTTTITLVLGERHSPEKILPTTKLITNWNGRYYRALETKDFIFFVNYQEGDENGCVMMYRKKGMELASDNYFGYGAMFEILTEKKDEITYISPTMKTNMKLHEEAEGYQCGSCENEFAKLDEGSCPHCGSGNFVKGTID